MASFDLMFNAMSFVGPIMFILVLGIILFVIVKGIRQWSRNNHAPILTVETQIVNLREQIRSHHGGAMDNHMVHHTSTTYYATFQVESGDRMELIVPGTEYGMLARGDVGKLTFQGTRYIGFERR